MKVRYLGKSDPLMLINGRVYGVTDVEDHGKAGVWYRIVDETGEDYIYPAEEFEVVSGSASDLKEAG